MSGFELPTDRADLFSLGPKLLDKDYFIGQFCPEHGVDPTDLFAKTEVFGGLMSTPIINPPQSAVLGLHRIEDRPVVVNGEIVIRPMMYIALSYDHRLIDGREAVTALKIIKEAIEDPTRMLIDL